MRKLLSFSLITISLFTISLSSCGPSEAEMAEARYHDSIDSAYFAEEQRISDSIERVDSIRNFRCPELELYQQMNERAIAILEEPGQVEHRADRYGVIADSIGVFFTDFMKNRFTSLDPICRKRILALSLMYTQRHTSAVNDLDPVARRLFPHEAEDRRTDSMANAIMFGE